MLNKLPSILSLNASSSVKGNCRVTSLSSDGSSLRLSLSFFRKVFDPNIMSSPSNPSMTPLGSSATGCPYLSKKPSSESYAGINSLYKPDLVLPLEFLSFGLESSQRSLYSLPPLSIGFTVLPTSALPIIFLPTIKQVLCILQASLISVGFSHLPASSRYMI